MLFLQSVSLKQGLMSGPSPSCSRLQKGPSALTPKRRVLCRHHEKRLSVLTLKKLSVLTPNEGSLSSLSKRGPPSSLSSPPRRNSASSPPSPIAWTLSLPREWLPASRTPKKAPLFSNRSPVLGSTRGFPVREPLSEEAQSSWAAHSFRQNLTAFATVPTVG
jgi:hypothetical protein